MKIPIPNDSNSTWSEKNLIKIGYLLNHFCISQVNPHRQVQQEDRSRKRRGTRGKQQRMTLHQNSRFFLSNLESRVKHPVKWLQRRILYCRTLGPYTACPHHHQSVLNQRDKTKYSIIHRHLVPNWLFEGESPVNWVATNQQSIPHTERTEEKATLSFVSNPSISPSNHPPTNY